MDFKQIQYLIELPEERQKRWLAKVLVDKFMLVKELADSDFENQKYKLKQLAREIDDLNTRSETPKIRGLDTFLVFASDLIEINEFETKRDDFIFEVEQFKRKTDGIIKEIRNKLIDKIQKTK